MHYVGVFYSQFELLFLHLNQYMCHYHKGPNSYRTTKKKQHVLMCHFIVTSSLVKTILSVEMEQFTRNNEVQARPV